MFINLDLLKIYKYCFNISTCLCFNVKLKFYVTKFNRVKSNYNINLVLLTYVLFPYNTRNALLSN